LSEATALQADGRLGSARAKYLEAKAQYSALGESTLDAEMGLDGLYMRHEMPVFSFEGHKGRIYSVSAAGDGSHALSAGEDGTIRLWDLRHGLEARAFAGRGE